MEIEGRHNEHEEAQKAKKQRIIDALPEEIRSDPELMAELDHDALKEYLRNAEKLTKLYGELDHPASLNWFHYTGNQVYTQKQLDAGVEKQFTKLVPPYPWLNHRAHNAASLVQAARILYTHGIGEEGPLDIRDLQLFLNEALGNYGLEVVPTQSPSSNPDYRDMEIVEPMSEEDAKKIVVFPRYHHSNGESTWPQDKEKEGTVLPFAQRDKEQDHPTPEE